MKYAPSFEDHMHRYVFAMMYAWKRDVLDAGCKEGFGSRVLSLVAKSVTLLDINERWLMLAKRIGGYTCKTEYVLNDLEKDPLPGTYDTVVAFEVIEHLHDPETFIANVAKALRPDGRLVFSVPHMVENDEHHTLFDEEKIKALIGKYLDLQEFYVQDKKYLNNQPLFKGLKCYVGVAKKRDENKV